jgi:hypothetical protein
MRFRSIQRSEGCSLGPIRTLTWTAAGLELNQPNVKLWTWARPRVREIKKEQAMPCRPTERRVQVSGERGSMNRAVSEIEAVYAELRREIGILGRSDPGGSGTPPTFPDPVALEAVERRVFIRSLFSSLKQCHIR